MTAGKLRTIWLPCLPACLSVFFRLVSSCELPPEAWLTKALQGERSGGSGLGWTMDALSIMAALGGGLRSRHVVVRERWSVRSQHSLTTPDPSSRQEQHRICLCGDSRQNGFFHSGQRAMCWPGEKGMWRGWSGWHRLEDLGNQHYQRGGFGAGLCVAR